ncbi:fructose-bisphosphatase class III [Streptococcus iniae]
MLDYFQDKVVQSYKQPYNQIDFATDLFWYLWCGEVSSLFGKDRMTTFERYYIADKSSHKENKNPYYHLREQEEICLRILVEFGLDHSAHIVNGHTPVKEKGENYPLKPLLNDYY